LQSVVVITEPFNKVLGLVLVLRQQSWSWCWRQSCLHHWHTVECASQHSFLTHYNNCIVLTWWCMTDDHSQEDFLTKILPNYLGKLSVSQGVTGTQSTIAII